MLKYIIRQAIQHKITTRKQLTALKRQAALKFKQAMPDNIKLFQTYQNLLKKNSIKDDKNLEQLLKTRAVRTLSGVAVITVLTKPYSCPGECLFCPNEKNMPKSYLPNEPAAMRAVLNKFDPYKQVKMRLEALAAEGHATDKIELIILGGTWSAYPSSYQSQFVAQCFRACNEGLGSRIKNQSYLSGRQELRIMDLEKEQKKNERAKHRIVGLTIETRPDYVNLKEIKRLRELSATRVELGVQSVYDNVLKYNRRKHSVQAIIEATKLLKDAGFKVNYHIMLNLPARNATPARHADDSQAGWHSDAGGPSSSLAKDEQIFDILFNNPNFQPDLLKIYPCVVLKNAPLYQLWKKGGYRPYSNRQLTNLLLKIKEKIPPYVRIQRIIRDIPKESIMAGSKISNLRQLIENHPDKKCMCIRCREIKNNPTFNPPLKLRGGKEGLKLFKINYSASDGQEIFLSYEDNEKLYALLRLRITSQNTAIIRELHTYGELAQINPTKNYKLKTINYVQHQGLGKKLIAEAEQITVKEFKLKKMFVISGIGVRPYYRKLGYKLKNTYMIKYL